MVIKSRGLWSISAVKKQLWWYAWKSLYAQHDGYSNFHSVLANQVLASTRHSEANAIGLPSSSRQGHRPCLHMSAWTVTGRSLEVLQRSDVGLGYEWFQLLDCSDSIVIPAENLIIPCMVLCNVKCVMYGCMKFNMHNIDYLLYMMGEHIFVFPFNLFRIEFHAFFAKSGDVEGDLGILDLTISAVKCKTVVSGYQH